MKDCAGQLEFLFGGTRLGSCPRRHVALPLFFALLLAWGGLALGAESAGGIRAGGAEPRSVLTRFANEILRRQGPDGAIVLGRFAPAKNRVMPYFANLAALGLVSASPATHHIQYLTAARRWADWYAAHIKADGSVEDYTGAPGAWRSAGSCDSTDSYAATCLELLDALAAQDQAWASARYGTVGRAVAAIQLTLQPNGLTGAKPGWLVMYTMDNVETSRGLRAAAHLATLTGHTEDAAAWLALTTRMEAAIESSLWDSERERYYVGLQPNGGHMVSQGKWYPDQLAELMAVGWGRASARNQALYQRLLGNGPTLPGRVKTEGDLDHLVWWGFAAQATADAVRLEQVRVALAGADLNAVPVVNTALLGHACRLLAAP